MGRFLVAFLLACFEPAYGLKRSSLEHVTVRDGKQQTWQKYIDPEKPYRTSLKQSLSNQSFNTWSSDEKTLRRNSISNTRGENGAQTTSLNGKQTYKAIGASSRSLEDGSANGTFSSTRGSAPTDKTTLIVQGRRGRVSEVLNSEFAKAAGASFGAAGAKILAEKIEERLSGGSDTAPAQGYAYPAYAPYYYR